MRHLRICKKRNDGNGNEKAVWSIIFHRLDTSKTAARILFPAAVHALCINNIVIYYFCYSASNIIHPPYLLHWIFSLELFGYTFPFSVFFYQPKKKGLCFLLCISEMGMKLAGSEQVAVQDFMMLL